MMKKVSIFGGSGISALISAKCICLKLQNIFVSNYKIYLSQITKCISLKLQCVFVSNYKTYLSQIEKVICIY